MAATTTSTLSDLFVNIVAQARFTAEEQSLMLGLVQQFDIAGTSGTTIQVPKYPAIASADLVEGTDLSSSTVTTTSVSIAVKEVGAQVVLTDLAAMGSGNPAQELGTALGNSIATKIDQDLIALFSGFGTSFGSAGTELTGSRFFQAAATLRNNKVTGDLYAVINPLAAYAMKSNFTNTFGNDGALVGSDLANDAMRSGYIGQIAGIQVFESANVAVDGDDDAVGAVFSKEALAIALKRDFNLETQRDASLRAWELNATACYGVGELDDTYGVGLLADAVL
jgi:N4-gp56 family major capsid protein